MSKHQNSEQNQNTIIQLSSQIQASNFNAKIYKKSKLRTGSNTLKLICRTTLTAQSQVRSKSRKKHSSSADKDIDIADRQQRNKKLLFPSSKRRKSHITDYSTCQGFIPRRLSTVPTSKLIMDEDISQLNKEEGKTSVGQLTFLKKFKNRSGLTNIDKNPKVTISMYLKDEYFQDTINQVIKQRCPQEKFDPTIKNSAIKRYQIDRNSMINNGLSPEQASRILKSLFVYSIGFNQLLSQMGNAKIHFQKNLWKAFSLLIQYCSHGSIELVISAIQRQKDQQIKYLSTELQHLRQIIEQNDSLNRVKNEKIYSQNKYLRLQNEQLQIDKAIITQTNEEHQRAFQEQVSLRLMFENKINQLHKLYRQLELKHHRLLSDFQIKMNELVYHRDKANYYFQQNLKLKKQTAVVQQKIVQCKVEAAQSNQISMKLKKELNDKGLLDSQRRIERRLNENLIQTQQMKELKIKNQLQYAQNLIQLQQKSHSTLKQAFFKSLQENNHLISSLHERITQITTQVMRQKQFSQSNVSFIAQLAFLKTQKEIRLIFIEEMKVKIAQQQQKIVQLQFEIQDSDETKRRLKQDIQANSIVVSNLKGICEELTEEKEQMIKYIDKLQESNKLLQEKVQSQKIQLKELKQNNELLQSQNRQKTSIKLLLDKKLQTLQKKIKETEQKYERTQKACKQIDEKMKVELQQKKFELQKTREAFERADENYKNEKFQRQALMFRYKHTLTTYDNSSANLQKKVSHLVQAERKIQALQSKIKLISFQLKSLQEKYETQTEINKYKILQLQSQLISKTMHVHPLILEDFFGHYTRLQQNLLNIKRSVIVQRNDHQDTKCRLQKRILEAQQKLQLQNNSFMQKLQKKEYQIQYQKKKAEQNLDRIQWLQLQLKAKQYYEQNYKQVQAYKQKQKRYIQIISDTYFKMNLLNTDLAKLSDINEQLCKQIQAKELILQQSQQAFIQIHQQKTKLQMITEKTKRGKEELTKEKANLQQNLVEIEAVSSNYVHQYQSLRSSSKKISKSNQKASLKESREGQRSPFRKGSLSKQLKAHKKMYMTSENLIQRQKQYEFRSEKMFEAENWREDFANKLKSSFNYYS